MSTKPLNKTTYRDANYRPVVVRQYDDLAAIVFGDQKVLLRPNVARRIGQRLVKLADNIGGDEDE